MPQRTFLSLMSGHRPVFSRSRALTNYLWQLPSRMGMIAAAAADWALSLPALHDFSLSAAIQAKGFLTRIHQWSAYWLVRHCWHWQGWHNNQLSHFPVEMKYVYIHVHMGTLIIGYCDNVGEWHKCQNDRFFTTAEPFIVLLDQFQYVKTVKVRYLSQYMIVTTCDFNWNKKIIILSYAPVSY